VGVVWIYSLLDLQDLALGGSFRETHPTALILALAVWLCALTASSNTFYRERLLGTLERLSVTPFSPGLMVAAKALVLACVAAAQGVLVWWAGRMLLAEDLRRASDPAGVLGMVLLALATVALGMFLATLLTSPTQIGNAVTFLTLGVLSFSGFFKPVEDLGAASPVARNLPFTLAYRALRAAVGGGHAPTQTYLVLAFEAVVLLVLTALMLRAVAGEPGGR